MDLLGVRIDEINNEQARNKVRQFLNSSKQHKIFTPNPEMLVDVQKDEYFKEVLNSSDLNICDGKGIELVSRGKLKRIPGVDFMLDICEIGQEEGKSIYLLGSGSDDVVKKTREVLQSKFEKLNIVGANKGPKIKRSKDPKIIVDKDVNDKVIDDIIMKAPDILFVAFGHGKQEKWIHEYLRDLSSVKIAMGVGGAFDYISGKVSRAPKFISKIGLEWLWRLVREPRRIKRIIKAVVVFPVLVLLNK